MLDIRLKVEGKRSNFLGFMVFYSCWIFQVMVRYISCCSLCLSFPMCNLRWITNSFLKTVLSLSIIYINSICIVISYLQQNFPLPVANTVQITQHMYPCMFRNFNLLILVKNIFEIKCWYPLYCSDCTLLIAVCLPNSSNQHHNLTTIKDSGSIYKSNLLQESGKNTDFGVFSNNNPAGNRISDF